MILIVGATGLIGGKVKELCHRNGIRCLGTSTTGSQSDMLKYRLGDDDPEELLALAEEKGHIDAVVIAGAVSNIHQCFSSPEQSKKINVIGTKDLLNSASSQGIKSVFLSSDAVFDGVSGEYTEESACCPATVYGSQKKEIEDYIAQMIPEGLVYRISKQYDLIPEGKNLFADIYRDAVEKKRLRCIKGLFFNPTYVGDIAACILLGIEKKLRGLYQVASPEVVERVELAQKLIEKCEISDCVITNEDREAFNLEEDRFFNASMNVSKFLMDTNYSFIPLDEAITQFARRVLK